MRGLCPSALNADPRRRDIRKLGAVKGCFKAHLPLFLEQLGAECPLMHITINGSSNQRNCLPLGDSVAVQPEPGLQRNDVDFGFSNHECGFEGAFYSVVQRGGHLGGDVLSGVHAAVPASGVSVELPAGHAGTARRGSCHVDPDGHCADHGRRLGAGGRCGRLLVHPGGQHAGRRGPALSAQLAGQARRHLVPARNGTVYTAHNGHHCRNHVQPAWSRFGLCATCRHCYC
jgi:hypothetical protein